MGMREPKPEGKLHCTCMSKDVKLVLLKALGEIRRRYEKDAEDEMYEPSYYGTSTIDHWLPLAKALLVAVRKTPECEHP
jgi:hypothetical protein